MRILCRVCKEPTTSTVAEHMRRESEDERYTGKRRSFRRHQRCVEKERPCRTCGKPVLMSPSRRWKLATEQIANVFCGVGCSNSYNKRKPRPIKPWTLKGLLRHIRHQAAERLEDGHGYEMMLTATIIEIDGRLVEPDSGHLKEQP